VPIPDPSHKRERIVLQGDVPNPINPPTGCHFHTRCPIAQFPRCKDESPRLEAASASSGHSVSCHFRGKRRAGFPFSKRGPGLREVGMQRRLISSGSSFEAQIGYSRAVVVGDWIFVSGTTGFDYSKMSIPDDLLEQTEQCLKNIEAALKQAE